MMRDKFFIRNKIELELLEVAIHAKKLNEDPEYKEME